MFLVLRALRRPLTVLVATIAILLAAYLALKKAPVDIFPNLGIPVVYVVQPYGGMSASQMEAQLVNYYEYHFLYIAGIEHIESQSIQGMAMLKLYFQPDTDIAQALSQVTAMAFRSTSFMPPGTLPPFIVRFDAGSIPVGQLVFSSPTRSESEIQDLALYQVRPMLATLPGVSAPPPSGGKIRTIVVYIDPDRLRSYHLSPEDVATTLAKENLTLPAGNIRIGDITAIAATNAMVRKPADLGNIPLRVGSGPAVYVRDVARVEDSADIVYNIALVNGRRTVYMPLTKRADASTMDVVQHIRSALPKMQAILPADVKVALEFDQSTYVKASIDGLVTESILGAILTSLMVLLFLRDWRSASIVVITIPLSLLAAIVGLRLCGQTINIMTLGGLALAVGVLVDEATVAIENIHVHLARDGHPATAVLAAMGEVMQPRFLAMVCVIAVFIPALFMVGVGKALFPPLALAVAFSMIASYVLSSTLVPVLAAWLFRNQTFKQDSHAPTFFASVQSRFNAILQRFIKHRLTVITGYAVICLAFLALIPFLGTELFPKIDTGQFNVRIRAPDGTRLERTEEIVRQTDRIIRQAVGDDQVEITLANIGNPPWSYPVNAVYVWNSGPQDALLLVSLKHGKRLPLPDLQERLRAILGEKIPGVRFSFEAGDIVSQVLNFGSTTPVSVTISGKKIAESRRFAAKLSEHLRAVPVLRDVQIPQALDYPTLDVTIDRELAGQFGVTVDRVGRSIVGATSSSVLVTPNFWTDTNSGVPYRVAVRVPENQVSSAEDLRNLPVMADGSPRPLVRDVATVTAGKAFGEIDHYNSQRAINVQANLAGNDLGSAAQAVDKAIEASGKPAAGTSVAVHGQIEQMRNVLASMQEGVLLAIAVILLVLIANFQSIRDALAVVASIPAVLAGVSLALFLTRSTLNVQSLMGSIMAIGVAVANALLLVTFIRDRRSAGENPAAAVLAAASGRLRPILMTSLAMIAGMIPMALGLGEGGGQTAPLGRAVIGGLSASVLATLFVIPTIYLALAKESGTLSASLLPDVDSNSERPRDGNFHEIRARDDRVVRTRL